MYNFSLRVCSNFSRCYVLKRTFHTLRKTVHNLELFSNAKYQILTYNLRRHKSFKENELVEQLKADIYGTQEDLDNILKDPEMERKYNLLKLEIDFLRHDAEKVPKKIQPHEWIGILKAETKSQRKKLLSFLWLNEVKSEKKLEKKSMKVEKNRKQFNELKETWTSGLEYGLQYNSLFLRVYDKTMDTMYNRRLLHAILHEPKVVYDCGFTANMNNSEMQNCVNQLLNTIAVNRRHRAPFDVYYCNANPSSTMIKRLFLGCPKLADPSFPINVTSQSYLDIFDKKRLIYLSPNSSNVMHHYDPEMVYIIGAIVDKARQLPLSYAKAKKEGIPTCKLPLDSYLKWAVGRHKNLTLDQILSILLDLKLTRDWRIALRCVPSRKIAKGEEGNDCNFDDE